MFSALYYQRYILSVLFSALSSKRYILSVIFSALYSQRYLLALYSQRYVLGVVLSALYSLRYILSVPGRCIALYSQRWLALRGVLALHCVIFSTFAGHCLGFSSLASVAFLAFYSQSGCGLLGVVL